MKKNGSLWCDRHRITKTLMIMKVCFLIALFFTFSASAAVYSQETRITIVKNAATIQDVLDDIEEKTDFRFILNDEAVDLKYSVNVDFQNSTIMEVLDGIFKGLKVKYSISEKNLIVIEKLEQRTVTGKVTSVDGMSIPGVSVLEQGTTNGVSTDIDGNYSIQVETDILVYSFVGMEEQIVSIAGRQVINVVLQEKATGLDEVVVTALGIKRKTKALSYNVQEIKQEELTKVKDANFVNTLAGKVAGVTINRSSAGIGGAVRVVMRGAKSIAGGNNVLYVIDGIPLGNPSKGDVGGSIYSKIAGGEGISDINPDDIESVSVLSGPSAAALYGSAAANGVILITTKKGEAGKLQVSLSSTAEILTPFINHDFQNRYGNKPGEFKSWSNELLDTPSSFKPSDFFRTGLNLTNSCNFSLGNKNSQTFISLASTNADGIVDNNHYDRYNFSFRNTSNYLNDKLHVDLSASYIIQRDQNMSSQGLYFNPLVPLYLFPRGDDFEAVKQYERHDPVRLFPVQYWPYGDQGLQLQNPYWVSNRMLFPTAKKRYMFYGSVKYDILSWMNIAGRVRVDNTHTNSEQKFYATTSGLFSPSPQGSYSSSTAEYEQKYADIMLNISKDLGQFNLDVNLGSSFEDHETNSVGFGGEIYKVANKFSAAALNPNKSGGSQVNDHRRNIAVFASAQLGWRNQIYLTLTGRNDWSSLLVNSAEPSFFYPSVGLSGVITEMVKLPEFISYLKVRTSYTEVGSPIPTYLRGVTPGTVTFGFSGGDPKTSSHREFPDFKAEKTRSYEAGVNLKLFNGRFNLDGSVYQSNTYNQTFFSQLSPTSGYSGFYLQAGDVRNRGIELAIGYHDTFGSFGYSTNVTYTLNQNKVMKLVRNFKGVDGTLINIDEIYPSGQKVVEGGQIGDLFVTGVLKRDREGNIELSKDGELLVDRSQEICMGSTNPDYTIGWNNNFNYKNLSLNVLLSGRFGGVVSSGTQALLDAYGVSEASAKARDNGGVLINGELFDAQKYYEVVGGEQLGAYYTYNATNVRVQEVSLSYKIPSSILGQYIDDANISLIGRNLWMIYNKAPHDPEMTSSTGTYNQGGDYFMPPSLSSYGLSLKVKF